MVNRAGTPRLETLKMKHQFVGARRFRLHIQIVYQSRFADEHGEQDIASAADPHHRLEGLGIHDCRVIDGRERLGIELDRKSVV